MADTTTHRGWTIPVDGQDPWYNSFLSLMNEVDADMNTALGTANGLDGAYNLNRTITVDDGAVQMTVPSGGDNAVLELTQNDTANNPNVLKIINPGSGIDITTDANEDLKIVPGGTGTTVIGNAGTADYVSGNDALFVSGNLEVTGTSYLDMVQFADRATPSAPGAGLGLLFKKTGDSGLYWRADTGSAVNLLMAVAVHDLGGGSHNADTLANLNSLISDDNIIGQNTFNANTILKADSDNTPTALTVAEQTLVGRITAGSITALTVTEVRTLLNISDGASSTFVGLTDTPGSYTTDGAIYVADNSGGQVSESTVILTESTNTFNITKGTASLDIAAGTALNIDANLTVSVACTLDQNLQQSATPTFGGLTLTGDVDLDENELQLSSTIGTDHTCNGITTTGTVDTNTNGIWNAMRIEADGNWGDAHADQESTMPCQALAMESGTGSGKKLLLGPGFVRDDSWSWTPGDTIYVSDTTSGGLTKTRPATVGDQVQVLGWALTATVIYFSPSKDFAEVGS